MGGDLLVDEPVPTLRKEHWLGYPQGPVRFTFGILGCSSEETHGGGWGEQEQRMEDSYDSSFSSVASPQDQPLRHPLEPPAQGTKGPTLSPSLAPGTFFLVSPGCIFEHVATWFLFSWVLNRFLQTSQQKASHHEEHISSLLEALITL